MPRSFRDDTFRHFQADARCEMHQFDIKQCKNCTNFKLIVILYSICEGQQYTCGYAPMSSGHCARPTARRMKSTGTEQQVLGGSHLRPMT